MGRCPITYFNLKKDYPVTMDSELNDVDTAFDVKMIFIGNDKSPSQRIVDLYLQSIETVFTTAATDDDVKPCEATINGRQTRLSLACSDGKDKYRSLTTTYFKHTKKVFLTYLLSNVESVTALQFWLREVQRYCDPDVSINILGFGTIAPENNATLNKAKAFADENRLNHDTLNYENNDLAKAFMKKTVEDAVPPEQPENDGDKKHGGCCAIL
ncbi:hypothetical protein EIN_328020 [Entamoeba invadens IP1]|uniref:Ras family protein n=1 Tax=Entamoeba invadens IP1 TaxID=370355 RepID=A0A0A1TXQ8_ENTIV|nr:hypothetical protein EIN_328020 [Entamoeba invadens IP1]ELP86145.1 hypothetical protein EIN_328020 [Entamoeba invadens IP1]|eukprot:XP_004185491.1 hypothetical protein EIN_328020 [Entamoeba invadens IP1]